MEVEGKRTINKYKQKIKEKMMLKKQRHTKASVMNKKKIVLRENKATASSSVDVEKQNPSEKQKSKLIAKLNAFKNIEESNKFQGQLTVFLGGYSKDLVTKVVDAIERTALIELLEEAIEQFCFGAANRQNSNTRTLSGIFMELAKMHIEESDPMKVKSIFAKSAVQQKKISKDKENAKIKISQSQISVNSNAKNRNMFDDLSD